MYKNKLQCIVNNKRIYTIHENTKLHTILNDNTKHNINKNIPHNTQSNYSQQAIKDNCKKFGIRVVIDKMPWGLTSILKT